MPVQFSAQALNKKQVGEMLGLSLRSVDRLRQSDPLFPKGFKLMGSVRWLAEDVASYLKAKVATA